MLPVPAPSAQPTTVNVNVNVTQVRTAYGRDPSTSLTVGWASNAAAPMTTKYLSAAGLSDADVATLVAAGLGSAVNPAAADAPPSKWTSYTLNGNVYGFPIKWGAVWDDPPTFPNGTFPNYTSPFLHNTTLSGLAPDTPYLYQIENGAVWSVRTAPAKGTFPAALADGGGSGSGETRPFRVSVAGDIGQTADSFATRDHMLADGNASFSLIVGDVSYADCDGTRWDSSGSMLEPLAASKPLMVCPGNHEIEYFANTGASFQAFEQRFFMPDVGAAEGLVGGGQFADSDNDAGDPSCSPSEYVGQYAYGNAFYSVDAGPLHLVSLNCYSQSGEGSPQRGFLEADLAAVDRKATPFVVIMSHCPFYSTNKNHYNEWQAEAMAASVEPLYMDGGVDLVLAGHVHAYQRSHPVFQSKVYEAGGAPTYITVGNGGNREGHAKGYYTPQPAWSAYTNDTGFGRGAVTVMNATHLLWEWYVNEDPEWRVSDSVWIVRGGGDKGSKWKMPLTTAQVLLLLLLLVVVFGAFFAARKAGLLGGAGGGGAGGGGRAGLGEGAAPYDVISSSDPALRGHGSGSQGNPLIFSSAHAAYEAEGSAARTSLRIGQTSSDANAVSSPLVPRDERAAGAAGLV